MEVLLRAAERNQASNVIVDCNNRAIRGLICLVALMAGPFILPVLSETENPYYGDWECELTQLQDDKISQTYFISYDEVFWYVTGKNLEMLGVSKDEDAVFTPEFFGCVVVDTGFHFIHESNRHTGVYTVSFHAQGNRADTVMDNSGLKSGAIIESDTRKKLEEPAERPLPSWAS